ncbi:MAG: MFS transporter [Kangiellaceae bacterium]|jgi:MFS family permease|nr:MFS transporter [Kangiellaceae bacterium]
MQLALQHRRYMMGVVMCLMMMPPGMWVTSLPNILETYDARWILPYATALLPIGALFSTLIFGALSDRKINAEKLLGILGISGAFFLWLGFSSLKWGWHPGWYLVFQGGNAIISGPMFALIAKVKLTNLPNASKSFPIYSMFGTIGWMLGGLLTSQLGYDCSADAGLVAACIRLGMGALCFLMPATPPTDFASKGWHARLGLNAFGLLKLRELRVFYIASMLFAIPGVAFFMMVPTMLVDYGSEHPTAQMTFGQMLEIFAMLTLSWLGSRFRVRWFILVGLTLGVLRFALFALAGELDAIAIIWVGIALHGPIYTFMCVTGRMFLDKRVPGTMRGQAQALFQLLVGSVAGIVGAFICEWLYQRADGWANYWWILAASAVIPLAYFLIGVVGQPRVRKN